MQLWSTSSYLSLMHEYILVYPPFNLLIVCLLQWNSCLLVFIFFCCFQGEGMTSIEPPHGTINNICVFRDSGLMFLALDSSQIPSYFIPALGPAPKWCSTLESLTVCFAFAWLIRLICPSLFKFGKSIDALFGSQFSQEELEESGETTIYDDYKFLTKEDLERLNLTNLIGTNLLRAYMHGFFIDNRLYKKVRLLDNWMSALDKLENVVD